MSSGELGNIRGAAVDEFLAWYGARDGERLAAAVRGLPAPVQEGVRWKEGLPRLMPFAWYRCELVHGIFDSLLEGQSDTQRTQLAQEVAFQVMEATLHGVYRAMFKAAASPQLFAKISPRLWRLYYDSGENVIDIEARNRYRSTILGWRGHHPFLCDINRFAGVWIYRALKCENVESQQLSCVGNGADECAVLTTWS